MKSNGLATVLLMIPVLTVPALAIFGIPQFAPVVASPIDESRSFERDQRGENSSRRTQDDFFDEIEGFSSEPEVKSGSATSIRNRGMSKSSQQEKGIRRADLSSASTLESESRSRWPNSPRQSSSRVSDELTGTDRLFDSADSTELPKQKALPRQPRRLSAVEKTRDEIRLARAEDPDQDVTSSGFTDEAQPRISGEENRRRSSESPGPNRRTAGNEPLTWAAAVERLNEFDIRSFRLEPGDRSGQFVFICSYPSPEAPTVSYRFEAAAEEPLKAVEKVIEQIVEWRRNR